MTPIPSTQIHAWVEACREGRFAQAICRVHSGWVVLGGIQVLAGYSLILPDPVVGHLNELDAAQRRTLLYEASVVGDALLEITGAKRINYEILGNLEPALHVHVFPRYTGEPAELRTRPVWSYDWEAAPRFEAARDAPLMRRIREYLQRAGIAV